MKGESKLYIRISEETSQDLITFLDHMSSENLLYLNIDSVNSEQIPIQNEYFEIILKIASKIK